MAEQPTVILGTDRDLRDEKDLRACVSSFRSLRSFRSLWVTLVLTGLCLAQSFPMMQSTFTGGELSPLAAARIDAQRYYTSVATMENMIASPQGPAIRRPGTRFVAATDSNDAARLMPFRYSADDVYVLEFTDNLMRVYRNHGLVVNDDNSIYTLATPFDGNEIDDLQMWQSADVCYIADGAEWPQKLVRTDHNDWDINDAPIDDGPFLPENLTATTIAASAVTGTDVNLTASTPLFEPNHVGGYWRLRDLVAIQTVSGTLSLADTNSATVPCQASNNFQWSLSGTLEGTAELQVSYDSGSTRTAYTVASGDGSISTAQEVYDNDTGQDVLLRVRCTERTGGSVKYKLWVHAYMHVGVVKITDYNEPCEVRCDIVRTLASTDATVRWSEGAWSTKRGFPRAIASYSDRLVLAGTTYQPVRMWFSATGDYEKFDEALGDDADSFGYTLGRSEQDPILWLTTQRRRGLLAGTTGSIIEIEPADASVSIHPSNPPTVTNTLALPCSNVPPVVADNILLVLQRNGRKVREVLYSYDADAMIAPDLTLFAEHVTGGGLTRLAWTSSPYTMAWGVRTDGQVVSLSYDRNYQVVAWSRQRLGGSGFVEDLCAIPGANEDELWLSVRRTVDSNTVRYVEYLAPWDFGTDQNDAYFVDCGLTYDSSPATTFSGLSHLEGTTVAICADGAPVGSTETVASGSITLDYAASVVHVGLPFTSTLATVRYDITGQQGSTWARQKSLRKATVSFLSTLGAKIGPDASHLFEPSFLVPGAVVYEGPRPLFTGDIEATLGTSFSTDGAALVIIQDQPMPMTVRAIVAQVEVR